MKKTIWLGLLTLITALCLCFGLAACDFGGSGSGSDNNDGGTIGPNTSFDSNAQHDAYFSYTLSGDGYIVEGYGNLSGDIVIPSEFNGKPVTEIGWSAFRNCSSLTSITIPDSVTEIGYQAFYRTAYYKDGSKWDSGVLYIGNHLIEAKTTISGAYTIRANTKTIASDAFYYCSSLTSITIPDSVTSIGDYAFEHCSSLTDIQFKGTVAEWQAIQKGRSWDYNTGKYTVTCTDGTVKKDGTVTKN